MKDFIIRLVQWHETFRKAELEALATLARIKLDILDYSDDVSPHAFSVTYDQRRLMLIPTSLRSVWSV